MTPLARLHLAGKSKTRKIWCSKKQQLFKAAIVVVDDMIGDLCKPIPYALINRPVWLPRLAHAKSLIKSSRGLNLLESNELSGEVMIIHVECPDERWQVFRVGPA
jgi:hypothetical protein